MRERSKAAIVVGCNSSGTEGNPGRFTGKMPVSRRWQWVLIAMALLPVPLVHAKYDDSVVLVNGDRLTGDVEELSRDMLRFETRAMDDVFIRWDQIERVETAKLLRIELRSGRRVVGSVRGSDSPTRFTITTRQGEEVHDRDELVAFVPLKLRQAWIDRVEGGIRFGLSGTKGSNTLQWNAGLNGLYRGEHFEFNTRLDTIMTDKSDDTSSQRVSFVNNYRRLLPSRWFWNLLAGYEKNDELGIRNRYSVGGGAGRYLFRSNSIELLMQSGVLASREFQTETVDDQLEAYVGASVLWFQHGFPKTDIRTEVFILPSLTQSGRVRSNLDLSVKREFFQDLFLNLSLYYSSDNKAPNDASADDWGVVTSVEYEF